MKAGTWQVIAVWFRRGPFRAGRPRAIVGARQPKPRMTAMQAKALKCRDLAAGDIFLKVADRSLSMGGASSFAIKLGQSLAGARNPDIVHAGIMFDSTFSIEAQGGGVSAHDMRVQNKKYGYYVYRCRDAAMARGAGTCAKMMFDIHKQHGSMKYDMLGAIGSLFGFGGGKAVSPDQMHALLDKILDGRNQGFFCSQFVVYVFQFVAEQSGKAPSSIFSFSDAKATPSVLAATLVRSPSFTEVGCLFPGER
jgi:hypothetical protein